MPTLYGSHVLEPCTWVYGSNQCAQGGPIECTAAQVTYVPVPLPRTRQGEGQASLSEQQQELYRDAASAQGATILDGTFDSPHARDVEHATSEAPDNGPATLMAAQHVSGGGGGGGGRGGGGGGAGGGGGGGGGGVSSGGSSSSTSSTRATGSPTSAFDTADLGNDEESSDGGGDAGVIILVGVSLVGVGMCFCRSRRSRDTSPDSTRQRSSAGMAQALEDGDAHGSAGGGSKGSKGGKKGRRLEDEEIDDAEI